MTSLFKPEAPIEEVISDAGKLSNSFKKTDYVIIFAGIKNILQDRKVDQNKLNKICNGLKNTNVIFIGATYCANRVILNKFVYNFNVNLVKTTRNYSDMQYIETNRILNKGQIINKKLELKHASKVLLWEHIYSAFIINKFVNYKNLKYIETDSN